MSAHAVTEDQLLDRVKRVLVLDWRRRGAARASVRLAIEDTLDDGLPRAVTPDRFTQKVGTVFQYVYESYPGQSVTSSGG